MVKEYFVAVGVDLNTPIMASRSNLLMVLTCQILGHQINNIYICVRRFSQVQKKVFHFLSLNISILKGFFKTELKFRCAITRVENSVPNPRFIYSPESFWIKFLQFWN